MKTSSGLIFLFLASIFSALSPCAMASSYDDAVEAAKSYTDSYEDIRKIDVDQLTRLVKAMCDADTDELASVADDEGSRVEGMARDQKGRLDTLRVDADSKILTALADPQTDDEQKEELSKYQGRIEQLAKRIQKIIDYGTKMGSNPVFNKLRKAGQMAHNQFYVQLSDCKGYRDIPVGDLKPDCILPADCMVIELKPDNDRAIAKGWAAAEESRKTLNTKEGFEALTKAFDEFSNCEEFKARVDCYKYCPEVDDDGEFRETRLEELETCKS